MAKNTQLKGTKIKKSKGEITFDVINYTFFAVLSIIMLLPFWHVAMQSLSSVAETTKGGFFLYPRGFNLNTYGQVFRNRLIYIGFANSIVVTLLGAGCGTFLTAMTGYAISKSRLRGRKFFSLYIIFTMLFSGGTIPSYLLMKSLKLINNRLALVLPGLINAYNVIVMRSFFVGIPESLEESAKIDGATDLTVFFRIIVPLSKASFATILLFEAVGYWNDYFTTVLYINDVKKWALQAFLRSMLTNTSQAMQQAGVATNAEMESTNVVTIRAASIMVASIPILITYPFLQRYFVKGVLIGGVKG